MYQLSIYAIPNIACAVLCFSIGFLVFIKNQKSHINRIFFFFTISGTIWQIGSFLALLSIQPELSLHWCKFSYLGVLFIPITTYHFVTKLLDLKRQRKFVFLTYLIGVFGFLPLVKSPYFFSGANRYPWGYWFKAGPLYSLFLLFFVTLMSAAFINLYLYYRKETSSLEKMRKRFLFIAFLISIAGSIDFLPAYQVPIYPFGYIPIFIYLSIVAYTIVRYRLMDINIVLTRAGIFGIVYALVLGIPFWLGYASKSWFLSTSFAVFLATLGPFIYTYLRRRAEDILFKDQRKYQLALVELSKTMGRIRDIDKLYKTIVFTVVDTMKVPFAGIYLKDEEYKSYQLKYYFPKKAQSRFQEFVPLDHSLVNLLNQQKRPLLSEEIGPQDKINLDHGLVIPCFAEDELLGFLALGPKPNNQMYTPDDVLIFETLSYSTALAIENCKFWKEIENRQRKARLQEMDSFAYSLAHEIDNPMTVLLNLPNFLRKHFLKYISDPQEQKDVDDTCKHMTQLAERVSGMVKAIRKFGEPTTGELSPLNLQEIIEGYSKLYAPEIKAHSIYFEKEMPAEPIYVNGVAAELQQVLIIFSNNAIHAMKYAEPKKIILKLTKANHNIARIAFSDTGYGIKPEKIETIFAPFVTSKASTEGTGMGLYNAKGLILRHKGRIWAESGGPNKGATFIIELPVIEDVKPEDLTKKDESKWKF